MFTTESTECRREGQIWVSCADKSKGKRLALAESTEDAENGKNSFCSLREKAQERFDRIYKIYRIISKDPVYGSRFTVLKT
jgi:hypothetical protein